MNKQFLEKMMAELEYAENKHPGFPTDRIHASAIINEEAGKLIQACIDGEYSHIPQVEAKDRMEKYAARVAAMAYRFWQSLPQ